MATFKKTKVSGPFKSFLEGTAGVCGVLALIVLVGSFANEAVLQGLPAVAFLGGTGAAIAFLASLIPSKTQYTEK